MTTTALRLPAGLDQSVPKAFRGGTHRLLPPEETVARLRPLLPMMGITRLANITGLDRIGVPVVVCCRPNSRTLAVSQGKGLDLASAKASALMESVETWHAERISQPLKLGSYEELRYSHRLADVALLPTIEASVFHPHLPLLWIEGFDLLQGEPLWVPYELVHTNYTLPLVTGAGCFAPSSNGLASGNHLLEAISHALCEVIERDATALWYLNSPEEQAATRIDPATVDDPGCRSVLDRFAAVDIAAAIWETTSEIGVPAFLCVIIDRTEDRLNPLYSTAGMGCHPVREVALLRALTEAAQCRLTVISGSRDDVVRDDYERTRSPDVLRRDRAMLDVTGPLRPFRSGPTFEGETFNDDLLWLLERVQAAGIRRVIVTDLTRPDLRISVVRVVVPGIEGAYQLTGYAPGQRARARLADQGRTAADGLVEGGWGAKRQPLTGEGGR